MQRGRKLLDYRARLIRTQFGSGVRPVAVDLRNGLQGRGTCLGCHDAPCMEYAADELAMPTVFQSFPGDPSNSTCPTQAIRWSELLDHPQVSSEACIGCGICISRCPYGAISLGDDGVARVEATDPDNLTRPTAAAESARPHAQASRDGQIAPIAFYTMRRTRQTLEELDSQESSLLVRNLLIECGIKCRIRRRGDTNLRMDGLIATSADQIGVLEIELGNAALESPRSLLEDVAVIHGRHKIDIHQLELLSVLSALPNARSEYYQVISDIRKVLSLQCRTITVGALLVLLWTFSRIQALPVNSFVVSSSNKTLFNDMHHYLGQSLQYQEPYPGAYRPLK